MLKKPRQQIRKLKRWGTHKLFFRGVPPVLCNSFPKSGTHLLMGIVGSVEPFRYYGGRASWYCLNRNRVDVHKRYSIQEVKKKLRAFLPGEIIRGHVEAHPEIIHFLAQSNLKHAFIYRDLRDAVISQFFYWEKGISADRWPFRYFNSLKNQEDKIRFLITGWPEKIPEGDFPERVDYPNVSERFSSNLAWLSEKNCVAVRYENLMLLDTRRAELTKLAKFLFNTDEPSQVCQTVNAMETGFDPTRSKTFRKGKTGEWKKYFSPETRRVFKEIAGELLITLGYEKDFDW